LREICPLKKMTPKYDAASGIIAGELLIKRQGLISSGGAAYTNQPGVLFTYKKARMLERG
jgi:hypothetical protein